MMEQDYTPLTKEILIEALLGFEQRLDARLAQKLDARFDGVATKDDLKQFVTKDDIRPTQIAVAQLAGDVQDIKYTLKTEYATKRELEPYRLLAERALKEMDAHRELRSTRGALLDDVADKVENHERRLRRIEGRD